MINSQNTLDFKQRKDEISELKKTLINLYKEKEAAFQKKEEISEGPVVKERSLAKAKKGKVSKRQKNEKTKKRKKTKRQKQRRIRISWTNNQRPY